MKILDQNLRSTAGKQLIAMVASDELRCPITHELLEDPMMCNRCGRNFSDAALRTHLGRSSTCPLCRCDATRHGFTRNRTLQDIIQRMKEAQPENGHTVVYTQPFVMMFFGAFGSGKSTQINLLVDPSGRTIIAPEASTGRGCTKKVESL